MKKILSLGVFLVISIIFSSCNGQIALPEKIGIKTSDEAVYNFSLSNKSFSLGDFFKPENFLKSNSSGEGEGGENGENGEEGSSQSDYEVYDYNPNNSSEMQQFLMRMDLQSISFNVDDTFNESELHESMTDQTIEKTIEIPAIEDPEPKSVDMQIDEQINQLITFTGITSASSTPVISMLGGNDFESVTYKSGYMEIQSTDLSQKIDGDITLRKGTTEKHAEFDSDGKALLNLAGLTITKTGLTFNFSNTDGIPFIAKVVQGSEVERANGLTLDDPVPISFGEPITIDNENESNLESYTIEEGSLSVIFKLDPSWENEVQYDYNLRLYEDIELEEGEEYPETAFSHSFIKERDSNTDPAAADLSGKSFGNNNLKADVTGNIVLSNSNLIFREGETKKNPTISIKTVITKIESATVRLSDDYEINIKDNYELSQDMIDNINRIKWERYGFDISYLNTLPAGNDITLSLKSNFFQTTDVEPVVLPNETSEEKALENNPYLQSDKTTEIGLASEGKCEFVDIDATVTLPGYEEENIIDDKGNPAVKKTIKIAHVEPGEEYSIKMVITPVFEWDTLWIDSTGKEKDDVVSTGMNLSSIFEPMEESLGSEVSANLEFTRIPMYLFCDIPNSNGFNNAQFSGIIRAYIGNDDGTEVEGTVSRYFLGNGVTGEDGVVTETQGILPRSTPPEFNVDENKIVTTDIDSELKLVENTANLADLLNKRDANNNRLEGTLCIQYNVKLLMGKNENEIEITRAEYESMDSTEIKLTVIGLIPLEFNVKEVTDLDLLKLVGAETDREDYDLLGRTEAPDYSDIEKYTKAIKSVSVIYEPSQIPFIVYSSSDMKIVVDLDGSNEQISPQEMLINGDTFTVLPEQLFSYPLKPSINLEIPKGTMVIPRNMGFSTELYLRLATSGEVIWLTGNDSE